MKLSLLACLAACLAVALAGPIGLIQNAPTTVMIDVTSDFVDSQRNQHIFQVAVDVQVAQGEVMLNGFRVGRSVQTSVQISAQFREIAFGTNQLVNAHNVNVGVQAAIQEQLINGALQSLSVQLLLSEVDGSLLSQVMVHEVIVFLNPAGAETSRRQQVLPLAQSRITTTTTSTAASTAEGESTSASSSTSAPIGNDSSDSSSSEEHDEKHRMEKCRVRRFFHWVHKQPFGVRVLIYAVLTVLFVLLCKFVFCLVTVCCCNRPRSRTTYLNNVKLHYVPLSLDEEDKKPLLI